MAEKNYIRSDRRYCGLQKRRRCSAIARSRSFGACGDDTACERVYYTANYASAFWSPVHEDLFDLEAEAAMGHIELARWADAILIAPATADFMARLAAGQAGDLLTAICLASTAPIAIAPAMNQGMWQNKHTQHNLQALQQTFAIWDPLQVVKHAVR